MKIFYTFIDKNCAILRKKNFNLKFEEIMKINKCVKSAVKASLFFLHFLPGKINLQLHRANCLSFSEGYDLEKLDSHMFA